MLDVRPLPLHRLGARKLAARYGEQTYLIELLLTENKIANDFIR